MAQLFRPGQVTQDAIKAAHGFGGAMRLVAQFILALARHRGGGEEILSRQTRRVEMEQQKTVGGQGRFQLAGAQDDAVLAVQHHQVVEAEADGAGIAEPGQAQVADRHAAVRQLALDTIDDDGLEHIDIQRPRRQAHAQTYKAQHHATQHDQTRTAPDDV